MTTVAIADDHKLVRDGIRWMLKSEGSIEIVGEASSGAALLALLADIRPDVVLLDVRMPGMSGLEVLEKLSELEERPRVLMLSMYHEPALVQESIALGAAGYINKSADRAELLEAIRVVGSGGHYLPGDLAVALIPTIAADGGEHSRRFAPEERELLKLLAEGLSTREIGARLGRSEAAIRRVLRVLFGRLGVHSRSEAVAVAARLGVLD
jgi:DNA-binding NarL/FixJ family response regulator